MKRMKGPLSLGILAAVLAPITIYACTTFCFQDNGEWIFGRNYDWMVEHCLVMVNKRGVEKTAATEDNPAQWVSQYGSITFNQYGREFPLGGMNEAGLVIELMWLEGTEYPHPDARYAASELQWIQYQLDNHTTVKEVIDSDEYLRITVRNTVPIHFLVCDRTGRAATVEYLNGKMTVHTQDKLPVSVLTNNTYAYCLGFYNMFSSNEGSEAFGDADYSLKRFFWAAQGIQNWNPETNAQPIDYAFGILDKVSVDRTMFSIVYDAGKGRIYYRSKSNPALRYIDFKEFDFACTVPVQILDIVTGEGDVIDDFTDYSYEANYELISKSYAETPFLSNMSEETKQWVAKYPETLPCKEQ